MISVACGHRASHVSRCAVMKSSTAHIWNVAENLRDVTPESWIEHADETRPALHIFWYFGLVCAKLRKVQLIFFCLNGKKSPLLALIQR